MGCLFANIWVDQFYYIQILIIVNMIVLPWYVRFTLDCTIVVIPLIYMHYHPCTIFFEYFQNRRRLIRRKSYDDYKYLAEENGPSVAETKTLYKDLGIEL